MQFWTLSSAP